MQTSIKDLTLSFNTNNNETKTRKNYLKNVYFYSKEIKRKNLHKCQIWYHKTNKESKLS
jgi:hypothetical protein